MAEKVLPEDGRLGVEAAGEGGEAAAEGGGDEEARHARVAGQRVHDVVGNDLVVPVHQTERHRVAGVVLRVDDHAAEDGEQGEKEQAREVVVQGPGKMEKKVSVQ